MSSPAGRRLVVGNWKMHLDESGARALVRRLRDQLDGAPAPDVAVAPPFTSLRAAADALAGSSIALAAQDAHWEDQGAFTGEVSPAMLAGFGTRFVIVGHSERRSLFGDSDERVRLKAAAVRRHGMVPIVCVGESAWERDAGTTLDVVERQIEVALTSGWEDGPSHLVVAYEPIWAIGTGRNATADQAREAHSAIRAALIRRFGPAGRDVRILYGGSATPESIVPLFAEAEIGGALVGGASLDADRFCAIATAAR